VTGKGAALAAVLLFPQGSSLLNAVWLDSPAAQSTRLRRREA